MEETYPSLVTSDTYDGREWEPIPLDEMPPPVQERFGGWIYASALGYNTHATQPYIAAEPAGDGSPLLVWPMRLITDNPGY